MMVTERFAKPLPVFFLGAEAANRSITQFQGAKYQALTAALGREDTKAIWYSFKHVEDLYKELVYLNADGLRVYLGQYDSDHPDYPGQLGLVMVPTRLNETTLGHEDIILENEPDFQMRPGSNNLNSEETRKAYNYGSPCPPVCPREDELKYPFNEDDL